MNDNLYYVWIPRFAYKIEEFYLGTNLSNIPSSAIKIVFLKGTTDYMSNEEVIPPGYQVHPAFKFYNSENEKVELPGFWVAKHNVNDVVDVIYKAAGEGELSKNFIVKFQSANVDDQSTDITVADIDITGDLMVEFNVEGMSSVGSYVTFELVIVNESTDLYANGPTLEVYNLASNQIVADNPETTDWDESAGQQMDQNSAGQYITSVWNQTNPFYTITITKTSANDLGQIAPNGGTQTYQVKIEMTAVPSVQKTDNFTIKFITV